MHIKSFIKTSVNVTETKIDEGAWKKISCAKVQEHWTKIEILCASFSHKPSL